VTIRKILKVFAALSLGLIYALVTLAITNFSCDKVPYVFFGVKNCREKIEIRTHNLHFFLHKKVLSKYLIKNFLFLKVGTHFIKGKIRIRTIFAKRRIQIRTRSSGSEQLRSGILGTARYFYNFSTYSSLFLQLDIPTRQFSECFHA
jgi:hypothetical protein